MPSGRTSLDAVHGIPRLVVVAHRVRRIRAMRVLVHHDPQTMEPLGVWSIPDAGAPVLLYLDTDARACRTGRENF